MDRPSKEFVELVLTCASWQEAQKIADHLLENRLVACVEFMEVKPKHWWEGKLDEAKEVKLVVETVADHFAKIEAEVENLHSYKTSMLQMLPVPQLSRPAQEWLEEEVTNV